MSRLLSNLPRLVFANAARPSSWAAVSPRPSSAQQQHRSISTALLSQAQPPLVQRLVQQPLVAPPASPVQAAGQTRAFKMPRSMRKVSSPVARNTGKGKTARKHSARSVSQRHTWPRVVKRLATLADTFGCDPIQAKRRRMRRGKIN